jgi:hypothetical protein
LSVHEAGKKYSMIESGSKAVPFTCSAEVFLQNVVTGGRRRIPEVGRLRHFADDDVLAPLNAARGILVFMCQTDRMAEFMCAAVPPSRKPRFIVASSNGMRRQSVPRYDQAPSDGSKRDPDLRVRCVVEIELQVAGVLPPCQPVCALSNAVRQVPPTNRTRRVEPLIQALPRGDIARVRPSRRTVGWLRMRSSGSTRS